MVCLDKKVEEKEIFSWYADEIEPDMLYDEFIRELVRQEVFKVCYLRMKSLQLLIMKKHVF
jgi:hypothetical protein